MRALFHSTIMFLAIEVAINTTCVRGYRLTPLDSYQNVGDDIDKHQPAD